MVDWILSHIKIIFKIRHFWMRRTCSSMAAPNFQYAIDRNELFMLKKNYFEISPSQEEGLLSDILALTKLNHLAITVRNIVPNFRKIERWMKIMVILILSPLNPFIFFGLEQNLVSLLLILNKYCMQKIIEIIRAVVKYSQNMMTDRLTDRKKKIPQTFKFDTPYFFYWT